MHAAQPPDPFDELCEVFDERDLIVCVGPSLSAMAGFRSVEQLALDLLTFAKTRESDLDDEGLRALVDEGQAPRVLELLARRLGRVQFTRQVGERLDNPSREVPELARDIAALRGQLRAVYTTNLDRLIERAFEGAWPSFPRPQTVLTQRRNIVIKLRGDLHVHDSWVLTESQAEAELHSPVSRRRRLFDRAYNSHHMLFVGFEPRCKLLATLLQMPTPPEPDEPRPSHFIVLEGSCSTLDRQALLDRGLTPLAGDARTLLGRLLARASLRPHDRLDPARRGPDPGDTNPAIERQFGCPYPGLEAFTYELRDLFFGRFTEVSEAAALLGHVGADQDRRWLAVEGPSGVGKSSFVHAGLVPALRRGFAPGTPNRWRVAFMRPGHRPLRALARAVLAMLGEPNKKRGAEPSPAQIDALEAGMLESPQALIRELARHPLGNHGLLLVVDQLEETISLSRAEDRGPFSAAIAAALDAELLYLITTIRSDHVPQLTIGVPALGEAYNDRAQRYLLPPISMLGLREAIIRPAGKIGVTIESALVEQILNDADSRTAHEQRSSTLETGVSTLALAAHVLRVLWDKGAALDKEVELSEYQALGGLEGALGKSADEVLDQLGAPAELAGAKALLLELIHPGSQGHAVRRTLSYDEAVAIAGGGELGKKVVDVLSGASGSARSPSLRVLVVHSRGQETYVDLVHECLITGWATYREWIDSAWVEIVLADKVRRGAKEWEAVGSPKLGLSADIWVTRMVGVTPRGPDTERVRRYQEALYEADQRKKARLVGRARVVAGACLVVGVLAGVVGGRLSAAPAPDAAQCSEAAIEQSRNGARQRE